MKERRGEKEEEEEEEEEETEEGEHKRGTLCQGWGLVNEAYLEHSSSANSSATTVPKHSAWISTSPGDASLHSSTPLPSLPASLRRSRLLLLSSMRRVSRCEMNTGLLLPLPAVAVALEAVAAEAAEAAEASCGCGNSPDGADGRH